MLDHNNPSSQHAWSYEWNVHLNHYLCPYGNNGAREREPCQGVVVLEEYMALDAWLMVYWLKLASPVY